MLSLRPRYHLRAASECSALISSYRWARSRSAREVMLTRYAMLNLELVEKLPCRADLSFFCVLQALTDTFLCVGACGNVEQSLIGMGVLHNSRCLPLHRKHHRTLAFFQLFHEVAGPAAESRQRLNVIRDVKHGHSPF